MGQLRQAWLQRLWGARPAGGLKSSRARWMDPVGHQNSVRVQNQQLGLPPGLHQRVRCEVMIVLVLAVITYCRGSSSADTASAWKSPTLRQQLAVFQRKRPRPHLCDLDRAFWVALRGLWPGWANALIIVKPDTVIAWHRAGFRGSGDGDRGLNAPVARASAWRCRG
jgi:hypothetical protein